MITQSTQLLTRFSRMISAYGWSASEGRPESIDPMENEKKFSLDDNLIPPTGLRGPAPRGPGRRKEFAMQAFKRIFRAFYLAAPVVGVMAGSSVDAAQPVFGRFDVQVGNYVGSAVGPRVVVKSVPVVGVEVVPVGPRVVVKSVPVVGVEVVPVGPRVVIKSVPVVGVEVVPVESVVMPQVVV